MDTKTLIHQFGLTSYVLERNLSELSQDDSLIHPPKGGNCLNWIVGHLTKSRNSLLSLVGQQPLFSMEDFRAYGDEGPFRPEAALPLDELKRRFKALQEPLVRGLNGMSADAMATPAPFSPTNNPKETIGSLLAAVAFHEAYHVGQTGVLRRMAGKEGVVKPPKIPAAM
jgi:uncharacterized damage-inducible protein DinB